MPHPPVLAAPHNVRPAIQELRPYVPGLGIDEIRQRYGCQKIVKMASNENPLGVSPLVQERLARAAGLAFRYPQGGNPRLVQALAQRHKVEEQSIVPGNGSDEIIDLLMRVRCVPGVHNVVCFKPCFGIYPVQAEICGIALRQAPLNADFSFPFAALRALVDENTALVFITTPDNPSGFCPSASQVLELARTLPKGCLLVVDEAYMDFTDEAQYSLLARGEVPPNTAILRTFSKSYGLAGLRLGYGILPSPLADYMWRARLPFSVNILAEEAGLAALEDAVFYAASLQTVREGRQQLSQGLKDLHCQVWPSHTNFIMFAPQASTPQRATRIFEALLQQGFIIRPLKSYDLPHLLRVSVGTAAENRDFLHALAQVLEADAQ